MKHHDFIRHAIGKPWVNRASGPDSYDCWGLVVAYYREVLGITIKENLNEDIQSGYLKEIQSDHWNTDRDGIVFMCFKAGIPAHCGLIFGHEVLHAMGDKHQIGQVTIMPVRKIKRLFKGFKVYAYC